MDDQPKKDSLSEEKAALVLERATQIEAQGAGEVGIEELRRAALDAGIAPEAFERALTEVRDGDRAPAPAADRPPASSSVIPPVRWHGLTSLARAGALGMTGSTLAAFSFFIHELFGVGMEPAAVFSLILAAFLVVGLAVDAVRRNGVRSFLADLAPIWAGLTMVFLIGDPGDADEILAVMSAAGLFAGVSASAFIALARIGSKKEVPPGDRPASLEASVEE